MNNMVIKKTWWQTQVPKPGIGFPLLLIIIGTYLLLKSLGYITENVSFWSVLLIAIGVYLLGKRIHQNTQ